MKLFGYEIKKVNNIQDNVRTPESIKSNISKIIMSWFLLSDEQKIKVANFVLSNIRTSIMGVAGDIDSGIMIDVKEYKNNKFIVNTDNSFYKTIIVEEEEVIEKWNNLF